MKKLIGCSARRGARAWPRAPAFAIDYPAPKPLQEGAQADTSALKNDGQIRIAYMPPATEFNYYIAIGEGIKAAAAEAGAEVFMLAPQSGADINGQMGMIQDVITQDVDAIILSTHDEAAAAPLVKKAVDAGIAVDHRQFRHRQFPDAGARRRRLFAARRHPQDRRLPAREARRQAGEGRRHRRACPAITRPSASAASSTR